MILFLLTSHPEPLKSSQKRKKGIPVIGNLLNLTVDVFAIGEKKVFNVYFIPLFIF